MSEVIIPLILFYIVGFGILMKCDVYEDFVKGAKDGLKTVVQILPTLIGLMVAVGVLRASGFLDMLGGQLGRLTGAVGFPAQLVPLTIVKMFSSSAATGLVLDIFKEFGTDSRIGLIASVMMSCNGDYFLYRLRLFYSCKGKKYPLYHTRRSACNTCRHCGRVWLGGVE